MQTKRILTASTEYTISGDGFRGQLSKTNTPVFVDTSTLSNTPDKSFLNYALQLTHVNYLTCKLIDTKDGNMIHSMYDQTLTDYLTIHTSVMNFPFPTKNPAQSYMYQYVPDTYTSIVKSMLTFVLHLHKKQKSLSKFTSKNLFIKDGVLKFARVWFEKVTDSGRISDFDSIRAVITEIFTPLPPLMKAFHDALLKYSNVRIPSRPHSYEAHYNFLINHVSLMSHRVRCSFVKRLSELTGGMSTSAKASHANVVTSISRKTMWTVPIWNDPSRYGPVYDAVCHLNLRDDSNDRILRICRNIATHMIDALQSYGSNPFTELQIDLTIMTHFGEWFVDAQETLHNHGALQQFL